MAQYAVPRTETEAVAVANPAPLGLSALALTIFVFGCSNAGFLFARAGAGASALIGLALFYGGLVQILAGLQEFKLNNTFGATLFTSYGGIWMALGVVLLPPTGIVAALLKEATLFQALGVFLIGWAIFTLVMLIGALRSNIVLIALLVVLLLTFIALAIGYLVNATGGYGFTWIQIGGWLGIIAALISWYGALAGLLDSSKAAFTLPTWPRE